MANYNQGQSKTSFVREVLREIGAVSENPPADWKQTVQKALDAHGLKMHQVTLYQTRKKMVEASSGKKPAKKGRPVGSGAKAAAPAQKAPKAPAGPSLEDLIKIKEFANQTGGLARLAEGIKFLQAIS